MDLNNSRNIINSIDEEIVKLLEKRFKVVIDIGHYKKGNNIPVYDEAREKVVIKNCINSLENKDFSNEIENIYKQIMNSCKKLEG